MQKDDIIENYLDEFLSITETRSLTDLQSLYDLSEAIKSSSLKTGLKEVANYSGSNKARVKRMKNKKRFK